MVTFQQQGNFNELAFSFEEVNSSRDAFLVAIGQSKSHWLGRIRNRLRSMRDRYDNTFTYFQRLAILQGLEALLAPSPMQADFPHAYAATYIKLFMRAYELGDQEAREALIGKWKDGLNQEGQLIRFLFELLVGILYSQWGNSSRYHDLGRANARFDWLINEGQELECWVEAKSTSWTTGCPLSPEILSMCRERIGRFIQAPKIAAFEGIIKIDYLPKGQIAKTQILADLDALVVNERISNRRVVGPWSLCFINRSQDFNLKFHETILGGERPRGHGLDILIFDREYPGPVCGISFGGGWDHSDSVIQNLKKALSQVKGAKLSAVWVQMSGMPIISPDVLKEVYLDLTSNEKYYHRFNDLCATYRDSFAGYYLALDPEFDFHPCEPRMRVRIPNIAIPNMLNPELFASHHFEITRFVPTPGKNPFAIRTFGGPTQDKRRLPEHGLLKYRPPTAKR